MKLTNEEKCTYCREYGNLPCDECNKKLEAKKAMSKTKFTKVAVEERLPLYSGEYITSLGECEFYTWNEFYQKKLGKTVFPKYWLEESPDREDEMIEMLEKLIYAFEGDELELYQQSRINDAKSLLQSLKQEK